MAEVQVRADEFRELAGQLKGAEKPILAAMRKEMRIAGKPAGSRILDAIADSLPHRGGLSAIVKARGSVSVRAHLGQGVQLQLVNRAGIYMGAFESGTIRHPVWGNRKVWRPQTVPGHQGEKQFEAEASALTEAVVAAMVRAAAAKLEARGG